MSSIVSPNRPGVEVQQVQSTTPAVVPSPALSSIVIAPCYQIVDILDATGALQADALLSTAYAQASLLIPQASFPDPRENMDYLDIDEGSVELSLYYGKRIVSLPRGSGGSYGRSFLKAANKSTKPVLRASMAGPYTFSSSGDVLVFALDVANANNTTEDVSVTLTGSLTAAEVAALINTAAGEDVAFVWTGEGEFVEIRSTNYGASASITLRPGAAAASVLFDTSFPNDVTIRIVGSGFRGQDDGDGDLSTPWIEFFRGGYYEDDTLESFPSEATAGEVWALLMDLDGDYSAGRSAAITFTGSGADIPLQAATSSRPGDLFYADGVQVGAGEVTKVESSRFKIGVLSATRSTYEGTTPTIRVYDAYEVGTPSSAAPLAAKYAYFVAQGLVAGSVSPEGAPAVLTGTEAGLAARPAIIASNDITFPASLAGLTLVYVLTIDGEAQDQETFTVAGGPFADASALADAFDLTGITVSSVGDRIVFTTTRSGADQALTITALGTINTALGFDAAVSDSGKDVEFCTRATVSGQAFSLPMPDIDGVTVSLTVVDSKGTHAISGSLASPTDADALVASLNTIAAASGVGSVTFSAVDTEGAIVLTATTTEGGADVQLSIDATDLADALRFLGFYDNTCDQPAAIAPASAIADYAALFDEPYVLTVVDGDGTHNLTWTGSVALGEATTAAEVAAVLNSDEDSYASSGTRRVFWYVEDSDKVGVRTVRGGGSVSITAARNITGSNQGMANLGFSIASSALSASGSASSGNATDTGADGLNGTSIGVYLDGCPTLFQVQASSNSAEELITELNALIGFSRDVASLDADRHILLTSALDGAASRVEMSVGSDFSAGHTAIGLFGSAEGSGRPNPDFWMNAEGLMEIGPMIMRESVQGTPFAVSSTAKAYVGYRALRLDVTASGLGKVYFDNMTDLVAALSPISTANPLGLAASMALASASGTGIYALGLDEAPAAAPTGTIDSVVRALEHLQASDIYAYTIMTGDEYLNGMVAAHALTMSEPANRREVICRLWTAPPLRASSTAVVAGDDGVVPSDNAFVVGESPSAILAGLGIPNGPVAYNKLLCLEVILTSGGATEKRVYSVSNVNNTSLSLRTSFTSAQNTDSSFSTATLSGPLEGVQYNLYVLGDLLLVTGTTRTDWAGVASTAASEATAYASRRISYGYHGDVETSIDGVVTRVPGYYANAVWAGMVSSKLPSQPFSKVVMPVIAKVYGTDDSMAPRHLDTIMDGGRDVLYNYGGGVASYHQVSTDPSAVELKEMSVTRALDWYARDLRAATQAYTGPNNITDALLEQISLVVQARGTNAARLGILKNVEPPSVDVDPDRKDGVIIDQAVTVPSPLVKITIRLNT